MIILLAFVRTVSIAILCLLAGSVSYALIIWLASQVGLRPNSENNAWIGLVCLVGAWVSYRHSFDKLGVEKEINGFKNKLSLTPLIQLI